MAQNDQLTILPHLVPRNAEAEDAGGVLSEITFDEQHADVIGVALDAARVDHLTFHRALGDGGSPVLECAADRSALQKDSGTGLVVDGPVNAL